MPHRNTAVNMKSKKHRGIQQTAKESIQKSPGWRAIRQPIDITQTTKHHKILLHQPQWLPHRWQQRRHLSHSNKTPPNSPSDMQQAFQKSISTHPNWQSLANSTKLWDPTPNTANCNAHPTPLKHNTTTNQEAPFHSSEMISQPESNPKEPIHSDDGPTSPSTAKELENSQWSQPINHAKDIPHSETAQWSPNSIHC